jgi:hypothetical protein
MHALGITAKVRSQPLPGLMLGVNSRSMLNMWVSPIIRYVHYTFWVRKKSEIVCYI